MTHTQLLNAQMNVVDSKELSGNEEPKKLIETTPIQGAPFTLVKQDELYFITIGNYMVTKKHTNENDCINELEANKWDIIISLIVMINDKMKEDNQLNQSI